MKPRKNEPVIKFLFAITVISCLLLILLIPGCNQESSQAVQPPQQEPEPLLTQVSATPTASTAEPVVSETATMNCDCDGGASASGEYAMFGLTGDIEFSYAPKLNETVKMNWCIKAVEEFEQLEAWVQFEYDSGKPGDHRILPRNEVMEKILLDGQLSYSGSLKGGEEKQFITVISFPMEGKWKAVINFLGKTVYRDLTKGFETGRPFFAGNYQHLYVTKTYGLSGLSNYFKYYTPDMFHVPNELYPAAGYVDIDKPPALHEPVEIRWGAGSTRDVQGGKLYLTFLYMEPGGRNIIPVPPEKIIISGDNLQSISFLSKNEQLKNVYESSVSVYAERSDTTLESIIEQSSMHFTTFAEFPEEGDWYIELRFEYTDEKGVFRSIDIYNLCFNISETQSAWGWIEKHR